MEKSPAGKELEGVSLGQVLEEELRQVRGSRAKRLEPVENKSDARGSLIGLAFSGGGIRSATFNLGILQGLAQLGLLRKFDYLSTVSGGGYIGSWLMAWMQHQKIGIVEVEKRLTPQAYKSKDVSEPSEVRFLRNYGNYLTPRKGLISADFWAFAASYLRNTLLNLTILLLLLLSLLLLPRAIVYVPHWLDRLDDWGYGLAWLTSKTPSEKGFAQYWAIVVGMLFGLVGVVSMGLNLCWVDPPKGGKGCWIAKSWAIHIFIAVPLLLSASLLSYGFDQVFRYDLPQDGPSQWMIITGLSVYFGLWLIACGARWVARRIFWRRCETGPASRVILSTAFVTSAVCGLLFVPYADVVRGQAAPRTMMGLWDVVTWGTPALVGIMLVAGALHIGLMGRQFRDPYREWWARLGGCLGFYAACWLLLFLIVAYVPVWLDSFLVHEYAKHHYRFTVSGVLLWAASTAYGVLFGKSPLTSVPKPDAPLTKKIAAWAATATPYIFILGLLAGLSVVAAWVAAALAINPLLSETRPSMKILRFRSHGWSLQSWH
jgi:Patatin-like phospholipase